MSHVFQSKWLEKFMSAMLCIGGGVLLATVFIHMIPEVRESLQNAKHNSGNEDHGYPLAELVVCAGFFIIFLIEALVHKIFGLDQGHSHGIKTSTKNEVQLENGIDNAAFDNTGPLRSPPDSANTTIESNGGPKTICSPMSSEDNHPDTVDATISPFGFKYK